MNGRSECDSRHVREDILEATYLEAIRSTLEGAADITDTIRSGIDETVTNATKEKLAEIEDEIISIQESMLALHKAKQRMDVSEADYNAQKTEKTKRIKELEAQRESLQDETTKYAEVRTWLEAFDSNIQSGKILTAQDSEIMRTIVEKVIIKDDGIEVYLKCGACIGQEYIR